MSARRGVLAIAAFALAIGAAGTSGALADPGCRGELSASLLQAMPTGKPIVLEVIDKSDVNVALGERFSAGMQSGGAMVAADGDLHLRLTFLLRNSVTNGVFDDFTWLQNPSAANNPLAEGAPRPAITMTATLTDEPNDTMIWVASVDCVVETTRVEALAYDLGQVLGRSMGKNAPLVTF